MLKKLLRDIEDFFKTQVEMKNIPDAINGRIKG